MTAQHIAAQAPPGPAHLTDMQLVRRD